METALWILVCITGYGVVATVHALDRVGQHLKEINGRLEFLADKVLIR